MTYKYTTANLSSLKFIYPKATISLFTIRHNDKDITPISTKIEKESTAYIEFCYSENVTYYLVISYDSEFINELANLLENLDIIYAYKKASQRDYQYLNSIAEICNTYTNIE